MHATITCIGGLDPATIWPMPDGVDEIHNVVSVPTYRGLALYQVVEDIGLFIELRTFQPPGWPSQPA